MRPRDPGPAKSAGAVTPKRAASDTRDSLQRRFSIAEVAEAFGREPRTIRSWIEKGLLEREKIGNAVFIRADQIEAMLRGSTRKKNPSSIKHKNRLSKNMSK
jgi:Helix-turn-helix domain